MSSPADRGEGAVDHFNDKLASHLGMDAARLGRARRQRYLSVRPSPMRSTGPTHVHSPYHGRRGRRFILYRAIEGRVIEIGRILHDQMDLQRQVPIPTDRDDG
jgi:plasmid stabilization system protein ParE